MDKHGHGRSSYNRADISLLFLAFLANPLQLRVYTSRTDLTDDEIGKRSTNIRHRYRDTEARKQ